MGFPPQGYTPIEVRVTEHETEWSSDPNVDDRTHVALTEYPLTEGDLGIVTYPSNANEVRSILLPVIKAVNQACTTHHIGIKVQYNEDDGAWTDIIDLTANPPMGLPSLDGVVDSIAQPLDISAIVKSGKKYEFRFVVESDNAGGVYYTTSFVLVLVYKMG